MMGATLPKFEDRASKSPVNVGMADLPQKNIKTNMGYLNEPPGNATTRRIARATRVLSTASPRDAEANPVRDQ